MGTGSRPTLYPSSPLRNHLFALNSAVSTNRLFCTFADFLLIVHLHAARNKWIAQWTCNRHSSTYFKPLYGKRSSSFCRWIVTWLGSLLIGIAKQSLKSDARGLHSLFRASGRHFFFCRYSLSYYNNIRWSTLKLSGLLRRIAAISHGDLVKSSFLRIHESFSHNLSTGCLKSSSLVFIS